MKNVISSSSSHLCLTTIVHACTGWTVSACETPPPNSIRSLFSLQTQFNHFLHHTLSLVFLPLSPTCLYVVLLLFQNFYMLKPITIITILSFHMTKPPQSASFDHICNAINTKMTVEFSTSRSTLQVNTTRPPDHNFCHSLQSCCIVQFHSQSFTRKSQEALNTGPVYLSFHFKSADVKESFC